MENKFFSMFLEMFRFLHLLEKKTSLLDIRCKIKKRKEKDEFKAKRSQTDFFQVTFFFRKVITV